MRTAQTTIVLTAEEQETLEGLARSRAGPHRWVQRSRLVLLAAEGMPNATIAQEVGLSRARVVAWRQRFAQARLAGLEDLPRPGGVQKYDPALTEQRILAQLDQPPPEGNATWTGGLVAQALGDVPAHRVWSVLRRHGTTCGDAGAGA